MKYEQLAQLQDKLGYKFNNSALLIQAMTHSSYANDNMKNKLCSNERFEFLGDSLLGMVVALIIFSDGPSLKEGSMSKLRADFVCEKNLAELASTLDLGSYIMLSKGEDNSGGRTRPSILADAFEAILAAMYLDGGFDPVFEFISDCYKLHIEKPMQKTADYKTMLQELIQLTPGTTYFYNLCAESGPDHNKTFHVEVVIGDEVLGRGIGKTKKGAEQEAARLAVDKLKK
ncbi:MAG: ribonuclease III [Oscillospiraceae bacterium]|nr:ribonuclease III [Oscillospiraceae bacterium]MCL2278625.1 ribonuclease III [Oscillospiraceae bacterium]